MRVLVFLVILALLSGGVLAQQPGMGAVTKYRYEKYPLLPSHAVVHVQGDESRVLARAEIVELKTGDRGLRYLVVEESHFGPDGELVYKALSMFDPRGDKTFESPVLGEKRYELFRTWPTSTR